MGKFKKWMLRGFWAGTICGLSFIIAQVATSGLYSQIPSSSPGGSLNFLTDGCIMAYNVTSAGSRLWFPQVICSAVTPPSAASTWTLVTSGSAAKADSGGSVTLSTTTGAAALEGIIKSVPSAPYTLKFTFRALNIDTAAGNGCGPYWANGSATSSSVQWARLYSPADNAGQALQVIHGTNYALAGAASDKLIDNTQGLSSVVQIILQDDNTNRLVIVSNGTSTVSAYSTPRTTFITPTHYGFGCSAAATGAFSATLLGVD